MMAVNPGSIWIDRHWSDVPKDEWIAVTDNGIIAQNQGILALYAELASLVTSLESVTIAYLPGGIRQ
jgi:hypothetical protein